MDQVSDYHERMVVVNVSEAKARLTELVQLAEAGERVVISRRNHRVVELVPVSRPAPGLGPRPFGLCAGEFEVPSDFDDPLPEEILAAFEGIETSS